MSAVVMHDADKGRARRIGPHPFLAHIDQTAKHSPALIDISTIFCGENDMPILTPRLNIPGEALGIIGRIECHCPNHAVDLADHTGP